MEKRERMANAKAAQWTNKLDVWSGRIELVSGHLTKREKKAHVGR
jgi:hypothetical protein